ncbi:MAG: DUF4974 domain-containing protein [Breznakibacter sp.]
MDFLKRYIHNTYTTADLKQVTETFSNPDVPEPAQTRMEHHWRDIHTDTRQTDNVDFETILHKIHHRINLNESQTKVNHRINWSFVGKVAAILAMPVLIASVWGTMAYFQSVANRQQFAVSTPQGQQSQLTLSDGTQVWLNSESSLVYTGGYGKTNRGIKLIGEGFFKVARNKDLPFEVTANNITVTALGTSFNVDACLKHSKVKVTLVEGAISIQSSTDREILAPGQQLVVGDNGKMQIQQVDTELYTSWHQGILIFKNELLEDIITQLEKRYDITFVFKDEELKAFRYRGRLRLDYSILKTLEILRISTGINYRIEGRVIVLDKE